MTEIRRLTSSDQKAFAELRLKGIDLFPSAFLLTRAEAEAADAARMADWLESGACFGAFAGEDLIGFAAMARSRFATARHRASIGPFYVSPAAQGGRAGQGLMEALIADALVQGIVQLELWVWSGNPRAIAFYARNGFERMGVMPRAVIIDGEDRDDYFMVCALDGKTSEH